MNNMVEKKFRAAFVAHVPDADPSKHRCKLETSVYELTSVFVKDDDEAIRVCKDLVKKEGVRSFILCPGFTHAGIARLSEAVGKGISINIARGDGPSNQISLSIMNEAGWFKGKGH